MNRINVTVPLLDDEDDHLTHLAEITGLKRYQVMRQALLAFTPAMADATMAVQTKLKRETMAWETILALKTCNWNRRVAASLLGISPSGVVGRIQRFKLEVQPNRVGRPSKSDLKQLQRVFNEQRALRLLGREQAGSGDSGTAGSGAAPPI